MIWYPVLLNGWQCPHRDLGCSLVVFCCKNSLSSSFFNWIVLDAMKYRLHGESWYFVLSQTLLLVSLFPFQLTLHKYAASDSLGGLWTPLYAFSDSVASLLAFLFALTVFIFSLCVSCLHMLVESWVYRVDLSSLPSNPHSYPWALVRSCLFIDKPYISSHENWNFNEFPPNPTFLNYTSI